MSRRAYHHSIIDYAILSVLFLICFFSFIKISGHTTKQLQIALITASAYAIWGIFHHLRDGDLHWKVVLEYTAFAVFGFISLAILLLVFV